MNIQIILRTSQGKCIYRYSVEIRGEVNDFLLLSYWGDLPIGGLFSFENFSKASQSLIVARAKTLSQYHRFSDTWIIQDN